MKRRRFFAAVATALGSSFGAGPLAQTRSRASNAGAAAEDEVIPYFLGSGELSDGQRRELQSYLSYQELRLQGRDAILPRGGRPKLAPTYRLLKWDGELGDPRARFVSPLSIKPEFPRGPAYSCNAQILGFHAASEDWPGSEARGTLSIEFRARLRGEPLTWLYAQQFQLLEGGAATLGLEYVAQRDGSPNPVVSDEPNIDIRIQLLRHRQKSALFGKILRISASILGLPLGGALGGAAPATGLAAGLGQLAPAIRIPQMLKEGVAFSQAMFGGMAEEDPLWRGAFNSYGIAQGGSRLGLSPGIWVALDESREPSLQGVVAQDLGGRVALARGTQALDANYLVLAFEVSEATMPSPLVAPAPTQTNLPPEPNEQAPPPEQGQPAPTVIRGVPPAKKPQNP